MSGTRGMKRKPVKKKSPRKIEVTASTSYHFDKPKKKKKSQKSKIYLDIKKQRKEIKKQFYE